MSRGNVGAMPALAWATALTTWVTIWPWSGFAENGGQHLGPLLLSIGAVTGAGILSRMARFPVVVVLSAQLLTVMLCANIVWGNSLVPTRSSIERVLRAVSDSVSAAQEYAAPVPDTAATIGPLIVLGGLLIHVLVDLLAVTLNRVPVAGLPLLAAYSLPVSLLDRQVHWVPFAFAAMGFLGMLALQESDRVNRWGRTLVPDEDQDRSGFSARAGRQHPAALGAWAIAAALLIPLVIPTLDLATFPGPGGGGGDGRTVSIENPMTDMKRDLDPSSPDLPAVRVTTALPEAPRYLRLAVLTEFTDTAWKPGDRDFGADQQATGPLPVPVGLDHSIPSTEVDWELAYQDDFQSRWLPTPMRLTSINAGDEWGYDDVTLDFHTYDEGADTTGTTYSLTELSLELDAKLLSGAASAPTEIRDRFTALPDDLTTLVDELARKVTAGQPTQYDQAVALQNWFRSDFEYSLDRDPGNGGDELEEFLAPGGRVGYCEQFASAMAVLARSLGIPARVAVGFLKASPVAGLADAWEFSTRDLHAWPELYFAGVGWVLFEPTPAARAFDVPAYTRGEGAGPDPSGGPTGPTRTAEPTGAPRDPSPTALPTGDDAAGDQQRDNRSLLLPLGGGAALLALLSLAAVTPGWLRRRRAAARWAAATDPPETAWTELRDSTVDLGLVWPAGRSPRAAARLLAQSFAAPLTKESPLRPARGASMNPEAAEALDEIVAALEQSRYAPPGPVPGEVEELRAATVTCIAALRAGVTPAARRRADWLPASVLRRGRGRVSGQQALDALQPSEGMVDSLQ